KRYEALARRLARVISRSLWLISEHIRRSSFKPMGYEVDFKEGGKYPPIEIELDSGHKLLLRGRIDRVDEMTNEEGTYLRVIDYKSGSKSFKLSDAYYGLQIQLLTYLSVLWEDDRDYKPGGVLYFHLDDPLIKGNPTMTEEEIENAIMKKLKMDGLLLEDEKVIRAMDNKIDGASLIIPVRINKNNFLSGSTLATFDHLKLLRNHIKSLLKRAGEEIVKGNVAIRPYRKDNEIPCTYCAYSAICQFDTGMRGNRYKNLNKIENEDIWNQLE
ncbi:MAG: PD-(D/E)XK nuclease family protein, partial [Eubacteriales bacterium]|nr:PD-(D/E)XK nuclease family protein [Eubacteriales bacterium]